MKRMLLAATLLIAASACSKNEQPQRTAQVQPAGAPVEAANADAPAPVPTEAMITEARMNGPISVNFRDVGFIDQSFLRVQKVAPVTVAEIPFPARKRYEVVGETTVMLRVPGDVVYGYLAEQDLIAVASKKSLMKDVRLALRQSEIRRWSMGSWEAYPDRFVIEWCGDAWRVIEMECRRTPAPMKNLARFMPAGADVTSSTTPADLSSADAAQAAADAATASADAAAASADAAAAMQAPEPSRGAWAPKEAVDTTVATDAKILNVPPPRYPPMEARQGIGGHIEVIVSIDSAGNVIDATISESSRNRNLDRAALEAARRWKFHPARNAKGEGLPAQLKLPVDFTPPTEAAQASFPAAAPTGY